MPTIECLIHRKGGSEVDIDGVVYHFLPATAGGPHIAVVEHPGHAAMLLAVASAYRLADSEMAETGVKPADATLLSASNDIEAAILTGAVDDTAASRDLLIAEYVRMFGKAPDKRWKTERIAVAVAEAKSKAA